MTNSITAVQVLTTHQSVLRSLSCIIWIRWQTITLAYILKRQDAGKVSKAAARQHKRSSASTAKNLQHLNLRLLGHWPLICRGYCSSGRWSCDYAAGPRPKCMRNHDCWFGGKHMKINSPQLYTSRHLGTKSLVTFFWSKRFNSLTLVLLSNRKAKPEKRLNSA